MVAAAVGLAGVEDGHEDEGGEELAEQQAEEQQARGAQEGVEGDVEAVLIDFAFLFRDETFLDKIVGQELCDVHHAFGPPFGREW